MHKWDYCALINVYETADEELVGYGISYFTTDGVQKSKIKGSEVAQVVAQLGEQGWEMVGCGTIRGDRHCIYFKRPKPQ